MSLSLFRRKLRLEITELENALEFGSYALSEIEVNIYCIASLIRKIIETAPISKEFMIKVHEDKNPQNLEIKFGDFINRIIHFHMISYAINSSDSIAKMDYINIISDYDIKDGLSQREVPTKDFLDIAKKIAFDDKFMLKSLLAYTTKGLKYNLDQHQPNNKNDVIQYYGFKTEGALYDLFSFIRKMNFANDGSISDNVFNKNIRIMFEVTEKKSKPPKVIARKMICLTYKQFVSKSGRLWYFPLNSHYINTYKDESVFGIKDQTIMLLKDPHTIVKSDIFCDLGIAHHARKDRIRCMIVAEDLLKLLDDFEKVVKCHHGNSINCRHVPSF